MLVASEGIENAIAKVTEGAMDGARIMAKISEYFPKLAEWLMDMRKLIEPLITAVEKIAAKAKELLQKIMKWLEEMLAWVKRQWERLLKWAEETFGEAGNAVKKLLGWGEKEAGQLEAEAEALEAANYAFEKLDLQLAGEAVPLTALEEKMCALAVPHTPDVQIHLHLITTESWRIEATAIKGQHKGVGLSVMCGGVLWTYETMIPYYTARGHAIDHETILMKAAEQLHAKATTARGEGAKSEEGAAYRRVEELARTVKEQMRLPVKGTNLLIKLESRNSPDVKDEGFSKTEFVITPNSKKMDKNIPVGVPARRFLPKSFWGKGVLRKKLYEKESGWDAAQKKVKEETMKELLDDIDIIQDPSTHEPEKAKLWEKWSKLDMVPHREPFIVERDKWTRRKAEAARYNVDHEPSLAKHWVAIGFEADDSERHDATVNHKLALMLEVYNKGKGSGGGHKFKDRKYVARTFSSDCNECDSLTIDGESFLDKHGNKLT
jgi:hypothetical protein